MEETAPRNKHSPGADEGAEFALGNVSLGYARIETRSRPIASIIHRDGQWTRPEKVAETLPPNAERLISPDTQITPYRLAA